jgi:hypothetical protein
VITLPAAAFVTEGDVNQGYRTFCFIVENGRAWRTPVQVGARDSQRVEVLKKQIRPAKAGEEGSGRISPAKKTSSRETSER